MATPTFVLLLTVLALSYPSSASMNNHKDQSLTSILSNQVFTSEINFCTLANRACSSKLNTFKPFDIIYQVYEGIDKKTPYSPKFDSTYFRESTLKPGNKIHLTELQEQFPVRADAIIEAGDIACHNEGLQKFLAQPLVSNEAIQSAIIKYCNMPSLKGSKTQSCTKSLQQMVEFSKTALRSKKLVALTTKSIKIRDTGKELQIGNVKKMKVDKMVTCHGVLLDSATYFCHFIATNPVIYVVDVIRPETKAPINTVLVTYHMDTSEWSKEHVAFKTLKSSPGKTEACHWNTDLDLIWVGNY